MPRTTSLPTFRYSELGVRMDGASDCRTVSLTQLSILNIYVTRYVDVKIVVVFDTTKLRGFIG
jgi:hypothetical protein